MANTKKDKLEKFARLHIHYLDSPIFIEIIRNQNKRDICYSYLYNYGQTYRLAIPISVLGEVAKFIIRFPEAEQRNILFEYFQKLMDKFEIEIVLFNFTTYETIPKLLAFDNRLEPMDCINYSCAISNGAESFVTLDLDFDTKLENEFGVKIKHLGRPY